jgi:hypothetical protein
MPRPGRFFPGKEIRYAAWAPAPVWRGAENLSPTWIRSADGPASNNTSSNAMWSRMIISLCAVCLSLSLLQTDRDQLLVSPLLEAILSKLGSLGDQAQNAKRSQ